MAFGNDALGVICSESGMNAKHLVHYVNDLFRDRLILSAGDPGQCSEGDRCDQKRVLSHGMTLLWIGASPTPMTVCGQYSTGRMCVCGVADVRFGSKADISECPTDVRFTPKSGYRAPRPLCAKLRH